MNIQQLFKLGMKRDLPELLTFHGPAFDIGSSTDYKVPNTTAIGLPDWEFPRDPIPAETGSVATIHCYHFLEHLSGTNVIAFLREAERVMIPGRSVLNFCMPYYNSNQMAESLDHKSFWCEGTFNNLFTSFGPGSPYGYDLAGKWEMRVHFIMIAGIVERNLCIIGQLVR
ncbi:hypothetical protein [Bradyrhizobium lablabi]|uniref:hypothetical protein n=1 Tax=Bradyrhizobium lablabi TaxID=722472 RepID=UPI0012AB83CD|nr:hypothetical protein [Bradyrhizobium lablabi]